MQKQHFFLQINLRYSHLNKMVQSGHIDGKQIKAYTPIMQHSYCSSWLMINIHVEFRYGRPLALASTFSLQPLSLLLIPPLSIYLYLPWLLSFNSSFSGWMVLSSVQQLVPQEISDLGWTLQKSQINVLFHYSHLNTGSSSSSQCHPEDKGCSTRGKRHHHHHNSTITITTAPSQQHHRHHNTKRCASP